MNKIVGLLGLFSLFLVLVLSQFQDVPQLNADAVSANNPIVVDGHLAQASYNLEFLGLTGGSTLVTAVQGSYLYAGIGSRFVLFDMADPAVPTLVGEVQLSTTIRKIEVNDNYAVVVTASTEHSCLEWSPDYYGGWYVIHLDNPAAPHPVFYQETDCEVTDIVLSDHYLYMAVHRGSLESVLIFDLANSAYPVQLGEAVSVLNKINGIATVGDTVYLAGAVHGWIASTLTLTSLDVTDPADPTWIGEWSGPTGISRIAGLAIANGYANIGISYEYSTPKLYILDIANPALPAEAAVVDLHYPATSLTAVANTLYLTHGHQGVSRLDIANPVQPTPAGVLDTPGFAVNLAANTDFVYVADRWRGLRVLDVTDPDALSEIASYDEIGMVDTITIADSHAYIAGPDMRILDLNNPQLPLQTSLYETVSQTNNIVISGTMAALAAADVQLVDVTNPYNPTPIGTFITPGNAGEVVLRPDQMIIADNAEGVHIVDITNPQFPDHVSTYNPWFYKGPIFVAGDFAYLGSDRVFYIVDLAHDTQPQLIGQLTIPSIMIGDIMVAGDHAFVAAWSGGLQIIDVADPYQPSLISSLDTPGLARAVAVSGNTAYVADHAAGLQIISIADVTNPQIIGSFPVSGQAVRVVVAEPYLFLADSNAGSPSHVRVLDITNPISPTQVSSYAIDAALITGFSLADNELYIGTYNDSLIILDVSNPVNPVALGTLPPFQSRTNDLRVGDNYVYLATYSGLRIIDVSDPTLPEEIATYPDDWGDHVDLREMAVSNNRAYLIKRNGFEIVDLSDPPYPAEVVTINSILPAATAALMDDHLLVGSPGPASHPGPFNLVALNILTPTQPFQTDSLPGYIRQVTRRGHFVYMIGVVAKSWDWSFNSNFAVVDMSDPTNLVLVSSYITPGVGQDTAVTGNFVYVADGWAGLRLLDVWNPAQPVLAGFLATPCFAEAVAARAEYIYVGCGEDGLLTARRSHSQVQTTITAADGGSLTYTDGNGTVVSLQVPPGAVTETVDLVLVPVTSVRGPQGIAVVQAFDLLVYQAGGEQTAFSFLQPATLTITYDDAAVGIIIDENELSLQWGEAGIWVEAGSNCEAAPPLLDVDNNRVTAEICGNNRYALWGPTQQSFLPVIRP